MQQGHTGINRPTHTEIKHRLLCADSSYLNYFKWITCWSKKMTEVRKTNYSQQSYICWLDSKRQYWKIWENFNSPRPPPSHFHKVGVFNYATMVLTLQPLVSTKRSNILKKLQLLAADLFKKSYRITTENYFCVRHKNRRKHNQHFKVFFQTKFTLQHIKLNIYMLEIDVTSQE